MIGRDRQQEDEMSQRPGLQGNSLQYGQLSRDDLIAYLGVWVSLADPKARQDGAHGMCAQLGADRFLGR